MKFCGDGLHFQLLQQGIQELSVRIGLKMKQNGSEQGGGALIQLVTQMSIEIAWNEMKSNTQRITI